MSIKLIDLQIDCTNPELSETVSTMLTQSLDSITEENKTLNIIKLYLDDDVSVSRTAALCETVHSILTKSFKEPFVIIPCSSRVGIRDITLTKVEVTHDFDERTEKNID